MTHRERLEAVFARSEPDRTPMLGGWIACPEHIGALTGTSFDEYWRDPVAISIQAYQKLGADGLIDIFVPRNRSDFRCVDMGSYLHARPDLSLSEALAQIEAMPSAEEIEGDLDFEAEYREFRSELLSWQAHCGDMVWMPAQWLAGARASWYADFGYENFFLMVAGHRDHARKLMEVGGARGFRLGRLIARAVEEGLYPHAILLGEDICTQRGPMISPEFLERYYAPELRHGLQPLLAVGCKPVWHSDGDVRPIMDMLIDCGVQGFQGFQPECGVSLDWVVQKRTREGEPLIIFGPLAVTTELPVCTPEEIRAKVRNAIDICRGNAHLVMFTSNTINPDVPLANILAMHEAIQEA